MNTRPRCLIYDKSYHTAVTSFAGINPESPSLRIDTRPDGRIVTHVILAWSRLILNHASGGNCRALQTNTKGILHMYLFVLIQFMYCILRFKIKRSCCLPLFKAYLMRTWYLDIQGEHVLVHVYTHTCLNMYYKTSIFI